MYFSCCRKNTFGNIPVRLKTKAYGELEAQPHAEAVVTHSRPLKGGSWNVHQEDKNECKRSGNLSRATPPTSDLVTGSLGIVCDAEGVECLPSHCLQDAAAALSPGGFSTPPPGSPARNPLLCPHSPAASSSSSISFSPFLSVFKNQVITMRC